MRSEHNLLAEHPHVTFARSLAAMAVASTAINSSEPAPTTYSSGTKTSSRDRPRPPPRLELCRRRAWSTRMRRMAVAAAAFYDTPEFGTTPPRAEWFSSPGPVTILFDENGIRLNDG